MANLPAKIPLRVLRVHATSGGSAAPLPTPLTLFFCPEDFTQEGPSGPIESSQTFPLVLAPLQQLRIEFEIPAEIRVALDFCMPAPMIVSHSQSSSERRPPGRTECTTPVGEARTLPR